MNVYVTLALLNTAVQQGAVTTATINTANDKLLDIRVTYYRLPYTDDTSVLSAS